MMGADNDLARNPAIIAALLVAGLSISVTDDLLALPLGLEVPQRCCALCADVHEEVGRSADALPVAADKLLARLRPRGGVVFVLCNIA